MPGGLGRGLPERPFAACRQVSTFVSKQALARFDRNDYSVPVEYAYHQAVVRGFVDRVEIIVDGTVVAGHERCYEAGEFVLDFAHYLPLLERKPGALHNARPFKGEPWGEDFTRMRIELEYRCGSEGTRRFVRLLLFAEFPVEAVRAGVRSCVERRAFSEEAVRSVLTFEPYHLPAALDLSGRPELRLGVDGRRNLRVYDGLLRAEVAS